MSPELAGAPDAGLDLVEDEDDAVSIGALAEALDVPLLTADRRLAKTAARYCDVVVL